MNNKLPHVEIKSTESGSTDIFIDGQELQNVTDVTVSIDAVYGTVVTIRLEADVTIDIDEEPMYQIGNKIYKLTQIEDD